MIGWLVFLFGLTFMSGNELNPAPAIELVENDSYNIISSYLSEEQSILLRVKLTEESMIGIELYDQSGILKKIWSPVTSEAGQFETMLNIMELTDGTYLLNVIINEEMYQQAVFKL